MNLRFGQPGGCYGTQIIKNEFDFLDKSNAGLHLQ